MPSANFRRVLVVGAGTMGSQIALLCAMRGLEVVVLDVEAAALERARISMARFADELAAAGHLAANQRTRVLDAVDMTLDTAYAARNADLVSESVPEDPQLKAQVFTELHLACPAHTVFTTNASSLVPSMLAPASGRPDRFAALHFNQPLIFVSIVEVMPHPGTAAAVVERLVAFVRGLGLVPIRLAGEHHGYVLNALVNAVNREALTLAANGLVSIEDIDRSWMNATKMRAGPFGIMDHVGLDVVWTITDYWARQLHDDQLRANAALVRTYVDRGALGVKTGRGFYTYPRPAFEQAAFARGTME